MLSAEAARLAALEVLCPKAALEGTDPYPTLALDKVFDSRHVGIDDLDPSQKFTPCLALYTTDSTSSLRGEVADHSDTEASATMDIVAELAIASSDDDGTPFADAMPADDWDARLVLAALCAQVRRLLQHDPRGALFRRFVRRVDNVTEETFAIPQLGARWHRVTMHFALSLPDDALADDAGLPEPIRTLASLLPEGSAAADRLTMLAAHFAAVPRSPLEGVDFADAAPAAKVRFTADTE